eukprot:gene14732-14859_t
MVDGVTISRIAVARAVRLVSTARLREAVLLDLVGPEDLAALAEIESATSGRLIAQDRGSGEVGRYEMVYGVPHASFINAAFAYAKPKQPSRFSGIDRGAWYAAFELETSVAEVSFHLTRFLADTGVFEATVDYTELFASFAGEYADLRLHPNHPSLTPDPVVGYPAGNALADSVRAGGHNGIVYPSVRRPGGTCIVALLPHAVQSVAQGDVYRMVWAGSPEPTIAKVATLP